MKRLVCSKAVAVHSPYSSRRVDSISWPSWPVAYVSSLCLASIKWARAFIGYHTNISTLLSCVLSCYCCAHCCCWFHFIRFDLYLAASSFAIMSANKVMTSSWQLVNIWCCQFCIFVGFIGEITCLIGTPLHLRWCRRTRPVLTLLTSIVKVYQMFLTDNVANTCTMSIFVDL